MCVLRMRESYREIETSRLVTTATPSSHMNKEKTNKYTNALLYSLFSSINKIKFF